MGCCWSNLTVPGEFVAILIVWSWKFKQNSRPTAGIAPGLQAQERASSLPASQNPALWAMNDAWQVSNPSISCAKAFSSTTFQSSKLAIRTVGWTVAACDECRHAEADKQQTWRGKPHLCTFLCLLWHHIQNLQPRIASRRIPRSTTKNSASTSQLATVSTWTNVFVVLFFFHVSSSNSNHRLRLDLASEGSFQPVFRCYAQTWTRNLKWLRASQQKMPFQWWGRLLTRSGIIERNVRVYPSNVNRHSHMYLQTYIHTYIHTFLPTYIRSYIHTYIHTYMHTCIHAYMHTCIHAYMHTCIHAYMHTCIHAYMHTCIHAYMHTYIHTYIHRYIDT